MPGFDNVAKAGTHGLADQSALKSAESQRRSGAGANTDERFTNATIGVNEEIGRDHDDGDYQIAACPKLKKCGQGVLNPPRNANGSKKLVGPPSGLAIAENEFPEWKRARCVARRENQFSVESKKRGYAIGGGRSVAKIAGNCGRVLNLHGAHFASGGLQAVEAARKRSSKHFAPRGAGAENNVLWVELNALDFGEPGNIEYRAGQGPVAKRRKNIRAASQDGGASVCENVESILKRIRTKVQKQWLPDEAATMKTFYFYNAPANL